MVLIIIDRLLKQLALHWPGEEKVKVFYWSLYLNPAGAFSWPWPRVVLLVISGLILLSLIIWLVITYQTSSTIIWLGLLLLISGGLSNFYDRVVWNGVIDYWHIFQFNSFNLADGYLLVGLGCCFLGVKQHHHVGQNF